MGKGTERCKVLGIKEIHHGEHNQYFVITLYAE